MQKKNTSKTSKGSNQPDPLAKYRAQAAPLLRIMFDKSDGTPDFMRDEVYEILTELENATQVFWNTREIAEVAVPLMLQATDQMGINWQDHDSAFVTEALGDLYNRRRKYERPHPDESRDELREELEADAEAIARIMHSPHVPASLKNNLGDVLTEILNECLSTEPEVLRMTYPLAVMRRKKEEEADGEQGSTDTDTQRQIFVLDVDTPPDERCSE